MDERTLADVGEFGLIGMLERTDPSDAVPVGVGDDAAVVAVPSGRAVIAVDQVVEGRHFRLDWSSAHDVGRKAAARAMSDIAAVGAAPSALVVAIVAPPGLSVDWALDLFRGISDEALAAGARVVGGDTAEGPTLTVSVTAVGDSGNRAPVLRSGARPGDGVWVAGSLGRAAAGLAVLSRGHRQPRALVDAHRTPEPPYAAGVAASGRGATAMIDVSDGLLADVGHLAVESGVVVDLERELLHPDADVDAMARNLGLDVWDWVLAGGEDHALVATFSADAEPPDSFRRVGVVRAVGAEGPRVLVDGRAPSGHAGHEHFR